jgi:chemotaxis signal transduction protein
MPATFFSFVPQMNETIQNPLTSINAEPNENAVHKLQLFRAGSFRFAIFEDQIATVAEWRAPTPLPHAPKSVMGVVSVQGRMLTVLDVATLTSSENVAGDGSQDYTARHIIALRGDEQLGLPADAQGERIEIADSDLEVARGRGEKLVLGVFNYGGAEISILNVKELFSTAIQGRERRRRRF